MTYRSGPNVGRSIVGHGNASIPGQLRQQSTEGSFPTLQKAVVIDVVYDTEVLDSEYKERLKATVNNYELVEVLPINSIIARIISNSGGLSAQPDTILFPLFSSHVMFPVQVGEIVNVIYEDQNNLGSKIGYWISRTHGDRAVEDVNYTHLDRRFDPLNNLGNWSTENQSNIRTSPVPGFPNGGETPQTNTLSTTTNGNVNPYDEIINNAKAGKFITLEPIPRWKKRPNELIFQGTNNSLLSLGQDRANVVSGTLNGTDAKAESGTLYAVVGRGRFMPPSASSDAIAGSPRVIKNSRGYFETDKAPWRNQEPNGVRAKDKPQEGEPDFVNDATTFILSQQTKGDENFGLTELLYRESTLPIEQPTNSQNAGSSNKAYAILKSDHIRMIARKNEESDIRGTILLIREGEENDLGYMFINEHGMNLDANKIYIGQASHENPADGEPTFNDDNGPYEPYILWSKYRDTVNSLQQQINDLKDQHETSIKTLRTNVQTILQAISTATTAPGANICPPGAPNPAVAAIGAAIKSQISKLTSPVDQPLTQATQKVSKEQNKNNKDNVSKKNHSQKIYGS
jgi:hypothetical protein